MVEMDAGMCSVLTRCCCTGTARYSWLPRRLSLQTNRLLAIWGRGRANPPSSPTPVLPRALHRMPFLRGFAGGFQSPVEEKCIVAKILPTKLLKEASSEQSSKLAGKKVTALLLEPD